MLAKLGLAKLGLGFGQSWCWPNLVWPTVGVGQTWQNSTAKLRFGQSWKPCAWGEFSRTGTTIVVVLPDRISGICCSAACTRCDTVVCRAAQCGPTGTATILDDTRSRNCGFFGPVTFPGSHVAQVLQCHSSWVGGEHLSGPQQELCVPPSVLDSLTTWLATQCEQFASGPHQGFVAEVPSPALS